MNEKVYTVKQIAELLSVSKPTVQKVINNEGIKGNNKDGRGGKTYDITDAKRIIKVLKPECSLDELIANLQKLQNKIANGTAKPQSETQTIENGTANGTAKPQTDELELMRTMVKTLQEQLDIKDKQIATFAEQLSIKDKQINDYSIRLAEAMELNRGQQYIAAADKVEKIAASNGEKNIFKKLFNYIKINKK